MKFELMETAGSLAMQILIFLTTIAGFLYQWFREERRRRWDLEDRRAAREQIHYRLTEAKVKAEDAATAATNMATRLDERTAVIESKIDHNTKVTQEALNEANNFNQKLAAVMAQFKDEHATVVLREVERELSTTPQTDPGNG